MKIHFISLGCKTNQYETNAMEQKFIEKGYDLAEDGEKADIYVVNTCSVTNIAERKSRQMLRRAKENNPNAVIVACGWDLQEVNKNVCHKFNIAKIREYGLVL